jgi:hypothetical protein
MRGHKLLDLKTLLAFGGFAAKNVLISFICPNFNAHANSRNHSRLRY